MLITILLSLMMMAGLFLMLWSGVGFIQDKKFFSSAPKEAIEVTPDYVPERFKVCFFPACAILAWICTLL